VLGTHLLNDESVVFALDQDTLERKRAAFWACGLGILLCWPAGAALGAFAGTVIEDTDAFGLDVMFPAVLLALIFPALRERRTRRAALVGAVVAVAATPFLPAGIPVLLSLVGLLFGFGRKQPKPEATA
jgi:predicted branched-subunit amino acid permease